MARHRYLLAARSNRRHHRLGNPGQVMSSAAIELAKAGVTMVKVGPMIPCAPVGSSQRQSVGSSGLFDTDLEPQELLALFNRIECDFGRHPGGRRWLRPVIEMSIVLWSGGPYVAQDLVIPHPRFREYDFVLIPAAAAAPKWRDPVTGLTIRQLKARLTGLRPLPRGALVLRTRWMGP